jgi:hypothetical protein
MEWSKIHLDEVPSLRNGAFSWRPVRRSLGISAFGINGYTADAGLEVIESHDETSEGAGGHDEIYFVATGAARFEVGGQAFDAPSGQFVFVAYGVRRRATASVDGTTVLVIGSPAGTDNPPSPFEFWYAAEPAYSMGDFEAAIRTAEAGLVHYPRHAHLNYQLACYRALADQVDAAVDHLIVAGADPRVAEWAADDPDLDSLRSHPRYPF